MNSGDAFRRTLRDLYRGGPGQPELEALLKSGIDSWRDLAAVARDPCAPAGWREQACWLLGRLGEKRAVYALLTAFREPDMRPHAAMALGSLSSRRAVLPLIEVLRTGVDRDERAWAANALGWIGDERARAPLLTAFRDTEEDSKVRGEAAEALAYLFAFEAVPALHESLADPSAEVRFWAMFALGELAGPEVIPDLERIAATDDAVLPRYWSLRKEALDMIEQIRTRQDCAPRDEG